MEPVINEVCHYRYSSIVRYKDVYTSCSISIHLVYVKRQRLVAQVLDSRGKLASRNSAPEQQAVPSLRTPNEWIWISLNRHPSTKRLWMCVDGSRVSYTRWNDMETNNSGGKEDCGHVMSIERRRRWNDRHCATLSL